MMHSEAQSPPPGLGTHESHGLPSAIPPCRDRQATIPFELEEYARWSCLPDEDDDLIFTAGPVLRQLTEHVPHVVPDADLDERLTPSEAQLLSLVDGVSPVSLLVELAGTGPEEALVGMCDLYARGLVAFD